MFKNLVFKFAVVFAVAMLVLGTVACSAAPAAASAPAASASTPSAAPTFSAPPTTVPETETATPQPQTQSQNPAGRTNPRAAAIPAALQRLELEGGIVTANDGHRLTLKLGQVTEQIQVNASTIVVIPGRQGAEVSDIQLGDRVIAKMPEDRSDPTARVLLDLPKDYTLKNIVFGAVQSYQNGTLNIKTRKGMAQITPTATTLVVKLGQGQPAKGTLKDMKRGSIIVAIGKPNAGSLDAQIILILNRNALQKPNPNAPTATPTP